MADLPTVDLTGVEILSTGGPIHGVGSPPEGDHWTADDLRAMAAAASELGDELKPPNKIGHSDKQGLVRANLTEGEMPAIGWLDNVRVNDDATKLLADIRAVPEKVANLIKVGAYRTRSVEMSRVTSQRTGKVYDWAITGMAWLGGKMPAVRTLDDVVKLYDEGTATIERQRVFMDEPRVDLVAAAPVIEEALRAFADKSVSFREVAADIRPTMPETTYTDEQKRTFAEATGMELDKVTDEVLEKAGVPVIEEPKVEPVVALEDDKGRRDLEARVEKTERELAAERKELHEERKRNFVEGLVRDRKITPGETEKWEKRYEDNPQTAREYAEDLEPHDELDREYGADGEERLDDEQREAAEKSYAEETATRLGIPVEQVL